MRLASIASLAGPTPRLRTQLSVLPSTDIAEILADSITCDAMARVLEEAFELSVEQRGPRKGHINFRTMAAHVLRFSKENQRG